MICSSSGFFLKKKKKNVNICLPLLSIYHIGTTSYLLYLLDKANLESKVFSSNWKNMFEWKKSICNQGCDQQFTCHRESGEQTPPAHQAHWGKEGKRSGKPGPGRGGCVTEDEGSRGDIAGFVAFLLFISIHTACFVKDVWDNWRSESNLMLCAV